jgi:hypothetical protein
VNSLLSSPFSLLSSLLWSFLTRYVYFVAALAAVQYCKSAFPRHTESIFLKHNRRQNTVHTAFGRRFLILTTLVLVVQPPWFNSFSWFQNTQNPFSGGVAEKFSFFKQKGYYPA